MSDRFSLPSLLSPLSTPQVRSRPSIPDHPLGRFSPLFLHLNLIPKTTYSDGWTREGGGQLRTDPHTASPPPAPEGFHYRGIKFKISAATSSFRSVKFNTDWVENYPGANGLYSVLCYPTIPPFHGPFDKTRTSIHSAE